MDILRQLPEIIDLKSVPDTLIAGAMLVALQLVSDATTSLSSSSKTPECVVPDLQQPHAIRIRSITAYS